MVRRSNPMFAKMSDAELKMYADQMEQAASNPKMLEQMMSMSNMSEKDKKGLQIIQEGISGTKPRDELWMKQVCE